jgi:hypothetical protein
MNDQKILDNAPEGATHIENNSNLYIKVLPRVSSTIFNDWFIFEIDQWIIIDTYNVLLMRSLADIKELVELRKANAEFEKDRDRESLKKEHAFKRERYLIAENLELKQKTFRFYNDEEYWIFQDDGEDYADSLVCPVVMSADQFRRLLNAEFKALKAGK